MNNEWFMESCLSCSLESEVPHLYGVWLDQSYTKCFLLLSHMLIDGRGLTGQASPQGCAQSWHQTLNAHNTVTFLWVSLFRQEPGQLLRKQWLSARRKVAERKESVFFLSPGWRSLRSQAMCRALVPSAVTKQRAYVPAGSRGRGPGHVDQAWNTEERRGCHLVRPQVPSPHTRHTRSWIYG